MYVGEALTHLNESKLCHKVLDLWTTSFRCVGSTADIHPLSALRIFRSMIRTGRLNEAVNLATEMGVISKDNITEAVEIPRKLAEVSTHILTELSIGPVTYVIFCILII